MRSATRPPPQWFILLFLWLFISLPAHAQDTSCTLNDSYPTYQPDNGILHIPAIKFQGEPSESQSVFQANLRFAEQTAEGMWFELLDTTPSAVPAAAARARYDTTTDTIDLDGYVLDEAGDTSLFAAAQLTLDADSGRFLLSSTTIKPMPVKPSAYAGNENVFELIRGGADQFLLPVEVGGQTLKLLVDTGSNALVVFEDRLADCNTALQTRSTHRLRTGGTPISKSYASGVREGVLATTSVRIGTYYHPAMKIMLVQTPDSQKDPSLTAKGADGIIGLRRTAGLNFNDDSALLDSPLAVLQPEVTSVEFDLPPSGVAHLAFGVKPILGRADANFLLRAKTLHMLDPNNYQPMTDMQLPFRAKTRYGEAVGDELDLLLDTGAVSRLVLDTQVAEQLGYDPVTETWALEDNEEIELNILGLNKTATVYPKFKVWEVSVAPYSTMGVPFEAVIGINRWQEYVVSFDYVSSAEGGPDGTISWLRRADLHAVAEQPPALGQEFVAVDGLNSKGNEAYPSPDQSGNLIAFQSDRSDGAGGTDVYVWQRDQSLLALPGLNTAANEGKPSLSADGRFLAYEAGNNIGLYDLTQQQLVDLSGLNSGAMDSEPALSSDGRYLAFTSERNGNPDIFLYDRQTNSFIDLPSVNTEAAERAPALTANGRFLSFSRHTTHTGTHNQDIQLYDVQAQSVIPLSTDMRGINTEFDEQSPALHLDNLQLAFHSNRNNPQLGLYDRDLFVVDMRTQIPVAQIGLNSEFDDTLPRFSGDDKLLAFQSRRPGGQGGTDIYLYQLDKPEQITPQAGGASITPDIAFTAQGDGQFSAPLNVGDQAMNLLVEMNFNALLVFRDSAAGLADSGQPVTVTLNATAINGTLATADVRLGQHQASNMPIVIADRAASEAALFGVSTAGMDGILGLSTALPVGAAGNVPAVPLQVLQPSISLWEVNFGATAGLTLGRRPATGSNGNALHTGMEGVDLQGPGGYTEMRLFFVALAYSADNPLPMAAFGIPQGEDLRNTPRAALTTLLNDEIILTPQIAAALGYNASNQSWGAVQTIDLNFLLHGSDKLLPTVQQLPVSKIRVAALANMDALLGRAYWQHYTLGVDYPAQARTALLFLADNQHSQALNDWRAVSGNQFIPLPGLNSLGDDSVGSLSVDARLIAFQSNRVNGNLDIYVWHPDQGLLELPGLNSAQGDFNPHLSNDGRWLAFESNRNGQLDVFVYDLHNQRLLELPNLNTEAPERDPTLSADGTTLAYVTRREGVNNDSTDIYLYDLITQQPQRVQFGWLNTNSDEIEPSLNADGSLLAFSGINRSDGLGGSDVYLHNLRRGLVDLPRLSSPFMDGLPALSADGNFLAFFSDRYAAEMQHLGNDIHLLEVASGELLALPGLNSDYTDTAPALSADAEFVLFSSNRPGGEGGFDLYLYHRDLADTTRYLVSTAYLENGYVTDAEGRPLAEATVQVTDGDGNALGEVVTDSNGHFNFMVPAGVAMPISYQSPHGEVVTDEVGDDTYVPDFEAGNLKFSQVWVEDTLQSGMPTQIWFDVETETPKFNTFVKIYLVNLATGSIEVSGL